MPEAEEGFEEEPGEDPEGSASPGDETPSEEPEDEFKSADAKKLRALLFKELGPLKESRQTVSELRDHIHRLSGMVEQLASRPEPQASREGGDSSRDQSGELDLEKYRPLFQRDFMGGVHTLVQDVLQRERAQNQNQVEDLVRRVREEVRQESS